MGTPRFTRRGVLRATAGAAALAVAGAGGYWYTRQRVALGLVGCGVRGNALAKILRYTQFFPVYGELVAVCDVDRPQAEKLRDAHCRWAELYEDYQKLLERDDLDAVIVATPDHWHAAVAVAVIKSGKAVYCEKPISQTIDEGKLLVRTVKESGVVFQAGLQQRHDWRFRTACELVRNGRLGTLRKVVVTVVDQGLEGGPFSAQPIPPGLNWDFWLGPAPDAEYCPERHHGWHNWQEYGGGEITNWGVHHLDIAHWAMGVDHSGPLTISGQGVVPHVENGYNFPRTFTVEMLYPHDVQLTLKSVSKDEGGPNASGVRFEGDKGWIFASRTQAQGQAFDALKANPLPANAIRLHPSRALMQRVTNQHLHHFLDCVRTGATPVSDVVSAHRTATACHLANLSILLGRELSWDAAKEQFVDDPEAEALLSQPRRAPYLL